MPSRGHFESMLTLRAAPPVYDRDFNEALRRFDPSRSDRDAWLAVLTRKYADGARIVIHNLLEAAACSIPEAGMGAPPEEPLRRAQVPIASVGIPSGWASAVAQLTGRSDFSPSGCLPLPGHQLFRPPRAALFARPGTLATTAPSSGAGPVTRAVSTVARIGTANRLPLAPRVPD